MGFQKFSLILDGIHFKRFYLIYIAQLDYKDQRFFYIGQTGDNYHLTSRPAIRRLSGHFQDMSSSTQNQLYRFLVTHLVAPKGLEKELTEEVRMAAEAVLVDCTIRMHVYPLQEFKPEGMDIYRHRENNKRVKEFEKHVVRLFRQYFPPECIINKQDYEPSTPVEELFPEALEQLQLDFFTALSPMGK